MKDSGNEHLDQYSLECHLSEHFPLHLTDLRLQPAAFDLKTKENKYDIHLIHANFRLEMNQEWA